MKTIFIGGAARNAGKTLVACLLLRSLPGAGGVKVTCCRHHGPCPRNTPCGVCQALVGPYAIITDPDTLAIPGKDTARMLEAAPGRVVWLQARQEALPDALPDALTALATAPVAIVEGNAAFGAARPDLGVLVTGPGEDAMRPSARAVLPLVDAVVRNTPRGEPPPALPEGASTSARVFTFDARRPEREPEADAFLKWVAGALGLPASC